MPSKVNEALPLRGFPGSSFRYTPLQHVRTLFVSFVQGLFAAAPPGDFHWDPDDDKTEIIIRDENPIHVDRYNQLPCVNFTIGACSFYSLGMDDMLGYDFATGKKTKSVLVPGTMSVNVSDRNDIQAHDLAWVIGEHVWLLRELIIQRGFFELGRGINISPPSPPGTIIQSDQSDEWFASTVSVPWQFARKSSFTPLGQQVVQSIETHLSTNALKRYESTGWPQGVNVHMCPPESFAPLASDARGGTPDPAGVKNNPLPLQPHPLNPAKTVVVRSVNPNRAGLRPASFRGAALPIAALCVEES